MKRCTNGAELILIGIENQTSIHYAMPVRTLAYDAFRYINQCKELERIHKRDKDYENADEFLSGVRKGDKLKFVLTLVVYYAEKPWDGATKLSEMIHIPERFTPYFSDHSIHLLQVSDAAKLKFENPDNQALFSLIHSLYHEERATAEWLGGEYVKRDVHRDVLAAIGGYRIWQFDKMCVGKERRKIEYV